MIYGILILVLLIVLVSIHVWRSKRTEKKKQYDQRLKEQALTESLKNRAGTESGRRANRQAQSMEQVIEQEHRIERNQIVVRLTISGKQNRDYVLNPETRILMGKMPGMNGIALDGTGISAKQCEIFLFENHVYLKNLSLSFPVVIRRKNSQMTLSRQAVRIITGDKIVIGNCRISVSMMDYAGNTIQG